MLSVIKYRRPTISYWEGGWMAETHSDWQNVCAGGKQCEDTIAESVVTVIKVSQAVL